MQRRAATTLLLAAPAVLRARDAPLRLRYPQPMRRDIPVRSLPLELLRRAVERAGRVVELEPSQHVMVQARSVRELAADSGLIDLLWTVTSREREQALRPVRIPIFRGLYGWRLLLVRRGDSARFAALRSLADLQPLRLLQGADWPDTRVLRDNGLRVETAQSFESLFKMLQAARGDAFPRGVTEIGWEQSQRSDRFEVEPALALHYPSAEYYFVSQRNLALAELLERGLERMQASGEHEELLLDIHGEALRAARLHERRVLSLRNAELPEATPLQRRALWWRPT
ncbi:substrate-binding periplasmic protein [Pseudorhodoferax sp.]|uniref:substrate-binding periplasmic protein n=1 Tax=Pseudorhodoferax sp. TaxID=1993553 RepID=UPI002DD6AA8D|nr:hypothetical protein [Pseudorhodoferax sp.]